MDKTLAVIGAGTMGSGIAHVSALHGYRVLMIDAQEGAVHRARQAISKRLTREVDKGSMTSLDADAVMERLVEADWPDASQAFMAIEAVLEIVDVKKEVFQRLDSLLPDGAILATNTSSLSITEIATITKRPAYVLGMHFFNPAPVMKLIEIVRGEETGDDAVQQAQAYARSIGKETVVVEKDTPGFVVNRVLMPLFIEAMRIYEEGIASKDDIDKAVKLGLNHPMGPLTLADLTGLDVDLHVMDYMYDEFHDDRFAAPLVLRRLVRAGRLGRKTGKGFYDYD
ncbi:MAG: 3-hydroxyacyl-CoA dehydrogenase NAD-binding domain-containing protein [Thermaerobacter sp.]|nr:3-hydroxyacyl-CoA dehydrogenase NAD-binding domain-containing protein [Thermaerobacter sp.]